MHTERHYGLIGYPLGHSFSPSYFTQKFTNENIQNCYYKAYPIASIRGFKGLVFPELLGLNVTIPYKEKILPYIDKLSGDAESIRAVNTIKFENGKCIGYNTDTYGFRKSLEPFLKGGKHKKALILGSGGVSKAIKFVLKNLEIEYIVVSRQGEFSYKDIEVGIMETHSLIINTTPLGMAPKTKEKPKIPYQLITSDHLLYDCIYNPEKTLFLREGERQGASIKNGKEMLRLQAEKSWEIWNAK